MPKVIALVLTAVALAVPSVASAQHHHHVRAHRAAVPFSAWGQPGWSDSEWRIEMTEAGFSPEEIAELDD